MWQRHAHKLHLISQRHCDATELFYPKNVPYTRPYIIGVCGGSGSGKTTFCRELTRFIGPEKVLLISQDSYYKDLAQLSVDERAKVNFDHPDTVEFSLLTYHLDELVLGRSIDLPDYDFNRHARIPCQKITPPKQIILVEGILLFANREVEKRMDHTIYIDTPEEVRFNRRLRRDVSERGRTPESVHNQFRQTVVPMHEVFVEPARKRADQVITGESSFKEAINELVEKISLETLNAPLLAGRHSLPGHAGR